MCRIRGKIGGSEMRWAIALSVFLLFALLPTTSSARLILADEESETAPLESTVAEAVDWDAIAHWVDTEVLPVPKDAQIPLSAYRARGGSGWSSFRAPFPPVPVWNPPGPWRVGLQAGHWQYDESPDELADLRRNPGTSGGGKAEWQVTLDVAQRTAAILRDAGVVVDVLSTTIPVRYRAHAFVAIHTDGDNSGILTGYKVAGPGFSGSPEVDEALVEALNQEYGPLTGLSRQDTQISLRMRWYYAFNARRYQHAVAPGVPQAIFETGFLTNASDRRLLIGDPDRVALGIASGVLRFLRRGQPAEAG